MLPLEIWLGGAMLASMTIYALGGGADFGGGVLDLFARGRTAAAQRQAIAHAIGPIWEANHVWLILLIVILFTGFPRAFAALSVALHVPLVIMLAGIVLRGSAFIFRSYDDQAHPVQQRWSRVFAISSIVTPITLGLCTGAIGSEAIVADASTGLVVTDFISAWCAPFPFAIGLLTLALFTFLAAVYLTVETADTELQEIFRGRALAAAAAVGVMALAAFLLAGRGAPAVQHGLSARWWSLPFQIVTGATAASALAALVWRRFRLARILASAQTTLVIWGWGFTQFPFIVPPNLTFANTAAPPQVMRLLLIALAVGAVLLVPSMGYLYHVFKGGPEHRPQPRGGQIGE